MASKKNRDIRSFFSKSQAAKPSASRTRISQTPTPAPEPSPQSNNGGPYSQSPSPLPEVPSSPPDITSHDPDPEPPSRAPLSRYAVIAASDDEEDPDSDEDLFPELGFIGGPRNAAPRALPAPRNPPAPARWNPCVTPRSKRTTTAPDFLSSPLTIQSKKKKHEMKSLLEFTRKDAETRASAQRFSALLEGEAEMQREDGGFVDEEKEESSAAGALKEHILESAVAAGGDERDEEEGGPDRMRIVRALERTELGGDSRRYYFFEHKEPEVKVVGRKFPKDKAKGAWAVLGGAQDRARHFASGFPYNIQKKLGNIPDEIFLWVLDEVCSEQRIPLQVEYRKLLSICHDQTQRLVTPTLLQQLFRNLGATEDVSELMAPITLREEASNPYPNRDWSCVENFLELLGQMSDHFTSATRSTAMQMLLRLGMDNIAVEGFGYAQKWREAAGLIAHSVPDEQWISFCQEICSSLSESTQKATMRWRAIALLGPAVTPDSNTFSTYLQTRTLDLKRRLASVFFFGDLQRADTEPEDTVHIRAIIDRLEDDEFQINQYTDYQELGALMMMLNVALGDVSKKMEVTEPSITSFDAEVDELAEGLKSMLTRVAPLNKGIHVSRIEAKNAMELIRERLLYQVRIKSVPKVGIFGKRGEEDSSVPRQRDFMKGFLLKKGRESSVRAESDVVKTEPAIKVEVDAAMAG